MAVRTVAALLWFFTSWSLGAAGALYLHADERLGFVAGVAVALLILHRELVALARAIAPTSRLTAFPQAAEDARRPAPPA